jgi:hypothetical protein
MKLRFWRAMDRVAFRWMCLDGGKWYNRPRIRLAFWLYDGSAQAHRHFKG